MTSSQAPHTVPLNIDGDIVEVELRCPSCGSFGFERNWSGSAWWTETLTVAPGKKAVRDDGETGIGDEDEFEPDDYWSCRTCYTGVGDRLSIALSVVADVSQMNEEDAQKKLLEMLEIPIDALA